MICKKCGTENSDSNKFCKTCGQKLTVDIMSDTNYNSAEHVDDISVEQIDNFGEQQDAGYSTEKIIPPTRAYQPQERMRRARRDTQPRANLNRRDSAPVPDVNPRSEGIIYDYNDNFENNNFDNTGYAPPPVRRRRKGGVGYAVVSAVTAVLSALSFALPFFDWISVGFYGINMKFNAVQLVQKLFEADDVNGFLGAVMEQAQQWNILPEYLNDSLSQVNMIFSIVKISIIIIFTVMAVALVLYLVFIFMALFRARGASGVGITASIFLLLGSMAFIFGTLYISSVSGGIFSVELMPYAAAALSLLIIIMSVVMAVARRISR